MREMRVMTRGDKPALVGFAVGWLIVGAVIVG